MDKSYTSKVNQIISFAEHNTSKKFEAFLIDEYGPEKGNKFLRLILDKPNKSDLIEIQTMLSNKRLRDKRSPQEYALDLYLGWIIEDTICCVIKNLGFQISLESKDKVREFLKRPQASCDLKVSDGKTSFLLEIASDHTGFWKKRKVMHLRENKYLNIKKENGVLLGLDLNDFTFFIEWISKLDATRKESHFMYGGKPAWELKTGNLEFFLLSRMKEKVGAFFNKAH